MFPALLEKHKVIILMLSISALLLLIVAGATQASAQKTTITVTAKTPPKVHNSEIPYVTPGSGKQMYEAYCATCHGMDGRGTAAVATALVPRPTDLTLLSSRNGGTFPTGHIRYRLMDVGYPPATHATDMPCWGPALKSLDKTAPDLFGLRVHNLVAYLETIQAPPDKAGTAPGSSVRFR